jgi:hypothetical protein
VAVSQVEEIRVADGYQRPRVLVIAVEELPPEPVRVTISERQVSCEAAYPAA